MAENTSPNAPATPAGNPINLAIIGGGPGGYAAAFLANDLGMKVTLIDLEKNPGGVCLYRGCIPSKALLHVAAVINEAQHSSTWGVEFAAPKIDVNKLRAFKQGVVDKLTGGLGMISKQRKLTYIQGRASFVDAKTLRVEKLGGGEETLSFDRILIATGGLDRSPQPRRGAEEPAGGWRRLYRPGNGYGLLGAWQPRQRGGNAGRPASRR
jgi:pyruvate/2-oxoglutarate dehydrogenase complex dihydrolipoamide dehydrogenase (E3) component